VLINAIQNQCSLGHPPKQFRDVVFLAAWNQYGRADFCRRLRQASSVGEIIVVNACTKGHLEGVPGTLREMVEVAIENTLERGSDLRTTHPASWASFNNRHARWPP
jgi:hypothetical protein